MPRILRRWFPTSTSDVPSRDAVLDALRVLAILLMIASHTTRLIHWDARRAWSYFALLIEPFTASLFLFLVGASLAHSWLKASRAGRSPGWHRRQGMRALGLWILSCVFYSLEQGLHWPDAVLLSGILATIAYTSVALMFLVSSSRPALLLGVLAAALMAVFVWMDARGIRMFMLNVGNSPLLPLSLFACLGAFAVFSLESGKQWVKVAWLVFAVSAWICLLRFYSFQEVFSEPLGRNESARSILPGPPGGAAKVIIPYYNLRPILVPAILAMTALLYAGLALVRPVLRRATKFLLPMGRHSLDLYVLHLSLLAILVLRGGKRPLTSAWQGDAVLIAVIVICYSWAIGKEALRTRSGARNPAGR